MEAQVPESSANWLEEHGAALYRHAIVLTRDPHRAEEAVQETLLAALQARERFVGRASVRTWLISILKHKVIDMFRQASRETSLEELNQNEEENEPDPFTADGHWRNRPSDWGKPDELLERSQFLAILQRCIDALPQRLARLFWLREVMEEDTGTICEEMAITPTNLWTMLYRARMGLRECLDRNWVGMPQR